MEGLLIGAVILLLLALIGYNIRRKAKMAAQQIGARDFATAIHKYGIPGVPDWALVRLYFTDEKVVIEYKKNRFELAYSHILSVQAVNNGEVDISGHIFTGSGVVTINSGGQKTIKGHLLILNYEKGHESKVLVFDIRNYYRAVQLAGFVETRKSGQTISF
jgi:hypothetical protein